MFRTTIRREESYLTKLAKLLPTEMVAVYTGLNGVVSAATDLTDTETIVVTWIVFGVVLAATIFYLIRQNQNNPPAEKMKWWEIMLTTLSFIIWSVAIGGAMRLTFDWWKLTYENLIVAGWTLLLPIFVTGQEGA